MIDIVIKIYELSCNPWEKKSIFLFWMFAYHWLNKKEKSEKNNYIFFLILPMIQIMEPSIINDNYG